jgi:sugar phosphate isomerase/epimerase
MTKQIPVALQLYTVRDEAAADFEGTVKQIADMGYAGVELAGTYDRSSAELKTILGGLGLRIAGAHVPLAQIESDVDSAIRFHQELGNRYIVCPWLPEDRRKSSDDYSRLAETLNRAGQACKEAGIQLCYHNHAFELERFNGKPALDIIFGETDPELLKAEIDTYWVEFGGASAVGYIRSLPGRVPLVHLKDMAGDGSRDFAELGQGIMEWDPIFRACEDSKTRWYIVEQDKCGRPPLESARISLEYLQEKGMA